MSGGPVPVWKKYTTGSTGIWEKVRQLLVLVPNRSSGNPLVKFFRAVPPGEDIDSARNYKEPVTFPTGDVRNNPYFKRDFRRNYPQVHSFDQSKVSGLLKLGSATNSRLSIGDKGTQELSVFEASPSKPVELSVTLNEIDSSVIKGEMLGGAGEPIVAPSLNKFKWKILEEPQHGMYVEEYPCRIFTEDKAV
ncbi:putative NADH-ubiquinone oxidoreductase 21.3 kDa subunit [[Candida] jaroonii]|uniref:NADH-ubiquinone oxidoreductase 21.3 kDa subunit n=1 Tax=[Candida] jaroonii TaxID=467808 RepID=A0ACA9YDX7_9ASCO|nr:putative NADH-ubiquinone oxidoreductase 21.3 kDa subunit [[Candida] jaroonii]